MDQHTPETDVAALVDAVRAAPERRDELVELLPERIPLYAGRGANAVVRLRGYILAAFGEVGLPPAALPYVLEELQNGRDAYLVAAAAIALRGLDQPTSEAVPYLLAAIDNVTYVDDAVTFVGIRPQWPAPATTTAMAEILDTFAWLGGEGRAAAPALAALAEHRHALSAGARTTLQAVLAGLEDAPACCHHAPAVASFDAPRTQEDRSNAAFPPGIELEDQDGRRVLSEDLFRGQPAIVVFFYTRCDNPNKCSLTITRLAELQEALRGEGLADRVRTAAVTYDPDFDLAPRLRAYGHNRGVTFTENDRFLRTRSGFDAVQGFFELGVSYGPALVNRHRIELFVLDREGRIAHTFARLQWDLHDVLRDTRTLVDAGAVRHH